MIYEPLAASEQIAQLRFSAGLRPIMQFAQRYSEDYDDDEWGVLLQVSSLDSGCPNSSFVFSLYRLNTQWTGRSWSESCPSQFLHL